MRIKSYFANSVQEAIDKARMELGPDTMLISSKQADRELKDLGSYEVVFGVAQQAAETPSIPFGTKSGGSQTSNSDIILRELAELRQQIGSFRQSMTRSTMARDNQSLAPEFSSIFDRLTSAGFATDLAQELTEAVGLRARPHAEGSHRMIRDHRDIFARDLLDAVLDEEIRSRFEVAPSLGVAGQSSTVVMFVGPPGSGKTSSLVKLGLQYGLKKRRPLHLVSLDTLRIGGWDQLSAYARISGVDFKPLQDFSQLDSVLDNEGLTLIDTPGFAKAEEQDAEILARAARDLPLEIHLVMPAYVSLPVAQETWKRFAKFNPSKLLLTHTDATEGPASVIEFAMRSALPLSFLSNGQQVPEDIEEASQTRLTEQLLPRTRAVSVAA